MSHAMFRVGAQQYLILGALAQAPNQTLTARQLNSHNRYNAISTTLHTIIKSLLDKGYIETNEERTIFTLTEVGAMARRSQGRATRVHYFPIPTEWHKETVA